ncbi:MAG: transglutaminase family protein [Hyphomicrobiales bacterium]|nr:transglutaminase family protein [Hyphomicrobiales bacterium]
MLINCGYEITFECPAPTPMICQVDPHPSRLQSLRAQTPFAIDPPAPSHLYRDMFGNHCRRFVAAAGVSTIAHRFIVEDSGQPDAQEADAAEIPVADLPDETLVYLVGSRYCETDRLSQIAWDLFGKVEPGWPRVQAICDFVHNHIRFGYENARATRTALEAYEERVGVCRDFAHLAVALCRCMNIPARYCNGYLGDIGVPYDPTPMDFNAWFEVYLGGQWLTFDARHNMARIGRVLIARGRDAADIPIMNSFGPHALKNFVVYTSETNSAAL